MMCSPVTKKVCNMVSRMVMQKQTMRVCQTNDVESCTSESVETCEDVPKEVCEDVSTQVCTPVEMQVCNDVPFTECNTVDKEVCIVYFFFHIFSDDQVCEDVEREECTQVEKEQCSPKTVTECNDVITEVCNSVPKEVCDLEKKIIMVEKTEEECSGPADVPSTTTTTVAPETEIAVKPSNSYLPPPQSTAGEKDPIGIFDFSTALKVIVFTKSLIYELFECDRVCRHLFIQMSLT